MTKLTPTLTGSGTRTSKILIESHHPNYCCRSAKVETRL